MTVDEFASHPILGRNPRLIAEVISEWELDGKLVKDDPNGMATMLAILGVDAAIGDGLLNQISPELQEAMQSLMGDKADTYDEARQLIEQSLGRGNASFDGFVSKIKGQIGEDRFVAEYPEYVLAISKNQEGVDALHYAADDLIATQIKMYANPDAVIHHMLTVRQKVANGLIVEGNHVAQLNFAVPENIAESVRIKMLAHPELANISVLPVKSTSDELANVVRDAGDNVKDPLGNLVGDVLESVSYMAALDALTNAYLVAKGRKSIADVFEEAAIKTPIGGVAITTSKAVALALTKTGVGTNPIVLPILVAIVTRKMADNWYENRFQHAKRLRNDADWLLLLSTAVQHKAAFNP